MSVSLDMQFLIARHLVKNYKNQIQKLTKILSSRKKKEKKGVANV